MSISSEKLKIFFHLFILEVSSESKLWVCSLSESKLTCDACWLIALKGLEMMNEAISKIENVVQGMLSFSRKQELTFSRIDIIKSIENAIGLTNFQLEIARITLKREYETQSLIALASPNHLEQVFVNILLNSIDAISERKQLRTEPNGEITVSVKKIEGTIKIEFSDNGTGMPEDKVASLFDPFFTLKKIRQGTGLGMAVSYNIISSHLGQIVGKNKEEGGFYITITLPEPLD